MFRRRVLPILTGREVPFGWSVEPLDGLPEAEVARRLGECLVFLSLATAEGCSTPPLETMACGCVVAGYHGQGGKEYFHPSFSRPVEAGDIGRFARAVEALLAAERDRAGTLEALGRRAAAFVRQHYSPQREGRDIAGAWAAVGEKCRRPVRRRECALAA